MSCGMSIPNEAQSDQIFQSVYHQVRLGDGVPLSNDKKIDFMNEVERVSEAALLFYLRRKT
jgi:hypothetical protein